MRRGRERTLRPRSRPGSRPGAHAGPRTAAPGTAILFNKPYGVLCQFGAAGARPTLKDYVTRPHVYPAGRLDADSEGLVLLTADGALQHRISDPRYKLAKTYWVEVEGIPDSAALEALRHGVRLRDYVTRPAEVRHAGAPPWLWPRVPAVRFRRHIPTSWLELRIVEGRNRQVRHMTAAVGLPTLRLVRYRIGPWSLDGLEPGDWREISVAPGDPGSTPRRAPR